MIRNLKPYPAYKDSGVPWLGQVPEHWDVVPNRALLRPRKDVVGADAGDYTLLSLTKQGIIPRDLENAKGKFPTNFDSYQLVLPGDLVFCLFDIDETPRTVGLSTLGGMITGAYDRFECLNPSDGQFVYYYYLAMDNGKRLKPLYTGLRKVIQRSTFMSAKMPLPPVSEQAAIVRYLDHADRKVRHAIRARQQLIKLLTEQKQAIIQRAVTRGLDPNVRLKPSGVPWLGDVPEHWGVDKIKHLARPGYKTFVDGDWIESPYITSDGIRLIQTGNIGIGTYREQGFRYVNGETFDSLSCTEVMPGDVLICRLGDPVGRACLAPRLGVRMITSVDVCILKPRADINPVFLVNVMTSRQYLSWVGSLVRGSTRDRVSRSMLGGFTLPMPPLLEQDTIVRFLNNATASLDKAIDAAHRELDLLREYRTRLIADVVTGKLDVRDVPVPDDETDAMPEELEAAADGEATDPTDDAAETESGSEETA